jgi:dTDP-glucose 4,6-dehydratase
MQLLITGGAGFIGANFAHYWSDAHPGDGIVVLDVLSYAGNRATLSDLEDQGRLRFCLGDVCDRQGVEALLRRERIDTIVHFAAESHNSLAVLDPGRFVRTNVLGTTALCDAARRVGVERLHHVSTCEVYGDLPLDSEERFCESSPYRPRTPYNASKAGADHVVRSFFSTFGLPVTITVCSNNYGPYQFPEKMLPLFSTRAIDGRPLPVYASSQHRREWLHVTDHCRAIEAVLASGRLGETYNVGSSREATVDEMADIVLEVTGRPRDLRVTVEDRPGHDRRYLLDSTKIADELGWTPKVDFEQGVRETVRWYETHESWWRPLIDRAPVLEERWGAPVPGDPAPLLSDG